MSDWIQPESGDMHLLVSGRFVKPDTSIRIDEDGVAWARLGDLSEFQYAQDVIKDETLTELMALGDYAEVAYVMERQAIHALIDYLFDEGIITADWRTVR